MPFTVAAFVLTVLFVTIVLPIVIVMHYTTKW